MLDRIINFFKSIFSFLGGSKEEASTSTTTATNPTSNTTSTSEEEIITTEDALPEIVDIEPQDGSDIPISEEKDEVKLINAEIEKLPIETSNTSSNPDKDNNTSTDTTTPLETDVPQHEPRYLWILDNGHGKKTKGKRSPKWNDGKRVFEYELNRSIVKKIMAALDKEGVKYHNLVPEENVGNILKTRVARANSLKVKSKLKTVYVSIHSNAGPENQPGGWSTAKGIETWYYRTSLSGRKIAKIFQKHLIASTGWVNRDVRTGMNFYVLKNTSMPAVLTENGFFNHKEEGRKLLTEETRQLIADAHVNAIMEIEKYDFDGFPG